MTNNNDKGEAGKLSSRERFPSVSFVRNWLITSLLWSSQVLIFGSGGGMLSSMMHSIRKLVESTNPNKNIYQWNNQPRSHQIIQIHNKRPYPANRNSHKKTTQRITQPADQTRYNKQQSTNHKTWSRRKQKRISAGSRTSTCLGER